MTPFGILYGRLMDVRNRLYDRGLLRSHSLGARTISIGNLTTGGTGKTPLAALIAEILAGGGEKVCILTRGYGRKNPGKRVVVSDSRSVLTDPETGGDEPVELALKLIGKAVVIADPDRVSAALWAIDEFGVTAFILDDGFQHRRAKRDLDIVCIDATDPFGNDRLLPAGKLRESINGLRRADAIVITRANLVDSTKELREQLRKNNRKAPIFEAAMEICGTTDLEDFNSVTGSVEGRQTARTLAFCGIGNPENFRRQLETENFNLAGFKSFDDHHYYTQSDIDSLEKEAAELAANSLITTAKDAVKLGRLRNSLPIYVAQTRVVINDEEGFRNVILAILSEPLG